jgi:hypothetical protein
MKRMHVHVSVEDLQHSIGFYSALFAAEPAIVKPDYAKWMLEDPRVNFAISTRGRQPGLDHLGIQVENKDELQEVYAGLHKAGGEVIEQGETACCYATSEKSWIDDPAGIAWETFHTAGDSIDYGDGTGERTAIVANEKACCSPKQASKRPPVAKACRAEPVRGTSVRPYPIAPVSFEFSRRSCKHLVPGKNFDQRAVWGLPGFTFADCHRQNAFHCPQIGDLGLNVRDMSTDKTTDLAASVISPSSGQTH